MEQVSHVALGAQEKCYFPLGAPPKALIDCHWADLIDVTTARGKASTDCLDWILQPFSGTCGLTRSARADPG